MKTPLIYLAGPIAAVDYETARFGWRAEVARMLAQRGIESLSPMRGKCFLERVKGTLGSGTKGEYTLGDSFEEALASPAAIVTRDFNDIDRCDLMLVNLLGAKVVSVGTVWEYGVAYALRRPVITLAEADNVHRHPMVDVTSGGRIVTSLEDAVDLAAFLLLPGI